MNGVLVVDKPRGLTSFDVVARVRRAAGQRRVGHAGTLDPMATGVLPVCVGEACKLVPFLVAGDKVYRAEVQLGVTTDTLDADGRVLVRRDARHLGRDEVARALVGFVGRVEQRPPMHSAIRVDGRRLYELARQGIEVERPPRTVEIFAAELDEFLPERATARLTVRCGKGTYVRSLAADLGERLGVGAHLTALRRTRVGTFAIEAAVPLDGLAAARPLGLAEALDGLPSVALDEPQSRDVRDGKQRALDALPLPSAAEGYVRLLRPDGTLLAVAERSAGRLRLARVFG
jgi:tRNA pseudouridine55 synthase